MAKKKNKIKNHHYLCSRNNQYLGFDKDDDRIPCVCEAIVPGWTGEHKHNGLDTPGGDSAIDRGCICPVLDNNHGRGLGKDMFWKNADCPIHGSNSPI